MNKIIITTIAILTTVTIVLGANTVMAEEGKIPNWFKTTLGYYVEGVTTDAELINALEFLIDDGIIQLSDKEYEPFSKEKFPKTGGFNPAWLKGERDLILETCAESKSMGYENTYCQYVQ